MSYGSSLDYQHHQAGTYAGRILKDDKPGVGPSAEHTPAWENKRVRPIVVYDGQLQVPIKRRARDVFPHEARTQRCGRADALIQIILVSLLWHYMGQAAGHDQ